MVLRVDADALVDRPDHRQLEHQRLLELRLGDDHRLDRQRPRRRALPEHPRRSLECGRRRLTARQRKGDHPMSDAADNAPTTTADQEQAPSRTRVLLRSPRRLIIAAILILIAVLVVVFTTATFTSSSANAGNMVAAGTLAISNDHGNAAILTAA